MKSLILGGILIMSGISSKIQASPQTKAEQHAYTEIHTDELKAWYDQGKEMIVVDARSKEYYEGTLLPKALWLPYNASDRDIEAAIPSKDSLVVVYCWNPSCPASKWLAERLIADAYTNVYKYPEGLQEWMQKGFPVIKN